MADRRTLFVTYARSFLAFNVLVIAWGALVRATGSGAGCGAHWPLCNGEWLPRQPHLHTIIELTHRAMSGLSLVGVIILGFFGFRLYPKGSGVRRWASVSIVLMLSEALIGAGLVLLRLVAQDTSLWRAGYLSVHLLNTFFLIAALTATAWWAAQVVHLKRSQSSHSRAAFGVAWTGYLAVAVMGGIAALGDTLFRPVSLKQGWSQDFSSVSHVLVKLRVIHPVLAIALGFYVCALAAHYLLPTENRLRRTAATLIGLVVCQLFLGAVNLALLSPVVLQLLHLVTADGVWIALVLLTLEAGRFSVVQGDEQPTL